MAHVAEPDVFEIVAAVKTWIESDTDMAIDDADAKPVEYLIPMGKVGLLVLYPDTEEHVPYEAGAAVRQNFRLVLDVVVDDDGEAAGGVRKASVTQAIRGRVKAYADAVRLHQSDTSHDMLRVAGIDWQVLNGQGFRGARLRLAGYRLWP